MRKLIKEMCKRVGADYEKIGLKKNNWWMEYSWTSEEQEEFKNWMIEELEKDKGLRKKVMKFPSLKRKYYLEKAADQFLLYYGWTVKDK